MKTTRKSPNRTAALFGKFDTDAQAQEIVSNIATWPKSTRDLTDRLGNYAQVVKWKKKLGKKRGMIVEARNHPAVDWLLELIVPALCGGDARPFRLIAEAIEARKRNAFPAHQVTLVTCQLALELAGLAMPFNGLGERVVNDDGVTNDDRQQADIQLPEIIKVPVSESAFRSKVGKRLGEEINPGTFTRILQRLAIRCRKDPHAGGRGRRVLHARTRRQKPVA